MGVGLGRLRSRVNTQTSLTLCLQLLCLVECVNKCGSERAALLTYHDLPFTFCFLSKLLG